MRKSLVSRPSSLVLAAVVGATALPTFGSAKRIDLSSSFVSTNYLNCVAQRVEKPTYQGGVIAATSGQTLDFAKPCAGGLTFGDGLTNLAARVAAMDAADVHTALLGSFVQVWDLPEADAVRVARESNNDIARAMQAYPGRFEGAALLPIVAGSDTCVNAAVSELDRCANELGFRVWIAASNFGADHLYDAKFEPLLKRAEELGVAIYLQDAYPIEEPFAALDGQDDPNEWGLALSNGQDLMVTATLMVMNGTFDRYPTLRVILPNLGEYLPFNLDRMSGMINMDSWSRSCEQTLFHYVVTNRNFILTTSGTTNEIPFACAKRVMGAGSICFGTGWPFDDMKAQADALAGFALTDSEREGMWGLNARRYVFKGNPMKYFRAEDAVAYSNCVHSITNVQQGGELYGMTWDKDADYHLDRVVASGCTDGMSALGFLCKNVLDNAPQPTVAGFPGCTAFMVTNAAGEHLVGRNLDYMLPMAHVLLFVPKNPALNRKYSSVGTVDAGWVGYDAGQLDDGKTDLSYAALFPYYCMDGMNEKGVMVTILALDARTRPSTGEKDWMIEQFYPDRHNVVLSIAIRYLLDNAGTAAEAVRLMENFNVFAAIGGDLGIAGNYHLYVCDPSGDTRTIEWMPPTKEGESWQLREVKGATAISNFHLTDGYGHGSNRWEIARHAIACCDGCLEVPDAMNLCRAVAQRKGADLTSTTHWSVLYNLDTLSADIATFCHYEEIFPYWFKSGEDAWEIGAAKSVKPSVESDLPSYDAATAEAGKVYRLATGNFSTDLYAGGYPSATGACVSAVNRMGCTYDTAGAPIHVVVKVENVGSSNALFYADFADTDGKFHFERVVAGVNDRGVSARVARFRTAVAAGSMPAAKGLCTALLDCENPDAAVVADSLKSVLPAVPGTGVIFTDAKGNVAVWPAGSEPVTDDASEMVRYSLDLRQGIYEIDGEGRGQFDELPGLMRLASSADTKAIVSMGYGHLDVMLPSSNVLWRTELECVTIPAYGVIAEPKAVAHARGTVTFADGSALEVNNQNRRVAETNALLKVEYKTENDFYFFPDGTHTWTRTFRAGETVTTPPAPDAAQPREPDYAAADGRDWLYNHAIAGKACPDEAAVTDVDLFYVYPTLVGNEKIVIDGFRGIDDETMRDTATNMSTAVGAYCNTARCFAEMMHVYVPFYRQSTLDTATDCATNAAGEVVADANAKYLAKLCEGPAYGDVTNALTTYFAKWNHGRKLVFAAHSQGSAVLRLVMENYFTLPENQDKAKQIICSYQIGFGIGQSSIEMITAANGMTFATKADDTNVIVSYNTMGESASGNSVLLPSDTLAINPITWTRNYDLADKDLNLGALTSSIGMPDVIVPHLYGAQVAYTGPNRGHVVVCKELNGQVLPPNLFGTGSLHAYDYAAYWENLRANVYDRGGNLAGFHKLCTTNFPKHLCISNATVSVKGKGAIVVDSVAGTVWIPTNGMTTTSVYLTPEKGYRLLVMGEEKSSISAALLMKNLQENGEFLLSSGVMSLIKVEWIQREPDYADASGKDWLFHHDIAAKRYEGEPSQDPGVDLFYFYPTSVNVCDDHAVDGICDIDDPYLRGPNGALSAWNMTAKVFGDFTHVYAPYYRQTPVDVEMSFPRDGTGYDKITEYWYGRAPYADVTNALTRYFTQINPDGKRPFVLAGHSHGAGMLILAMEHFFKDHPEWLGNMVACYAIGMGVSDKWEEAVKGYAPIATNATDTGVYVFWNTEGPGTSEEMVSGLWPTNHVAGVNPITWTRTNEYAPATLNLGGLTADDSGAVRPGLYDASNNVAHGTVVCSSPDLVARYMDPSWGFGEKSLHGWDYKIYRENIRANALQRIKTMKAKLGEPDYAQIPLAGVPIDYGNPDNWVTNTGTAKLLDVFYVYPTMMLDGDSTVVPVTDAMKEKAYANAYVGAAEAFADYANVLIPAYRQQNGAVVGVATTLYPEPRDFIDFMKGQTPRTDLFAAFDYYFTNLNANVKRPFILAGHSQGSAMLKIAFEDYFRSNDTRKGYLKQMVATYGLGYSFEKDWFDGYYPDKELTFATNATDKAALVSWNTEGLNAQLHSFVIGSGALAINPMTWTTNANAWSETVPDAMIQARTATDYDYAPGTYALVTTNRTDYLPTAGGMGEKSLHGYDWKLWYEQIKENGFVRFATFAGFVEVRTNGVPTVADATWLVMADGVEATVSPVDGKFYVPSAAKKVQLVCLLDEDKAAEGYRFAGGDATASFPMVFGDNVWKPAATEAEIAAATESGDAPEATLGSVAQRYPWNGMVDILCRLRFAAAAEVTLTVTADGQATNRVVSLVNGVNALAFDARAAFGEIRCEDVRFAFPDGDSAAGDAWSGSRTVVLDTRGRIVVNAPEKVLPIAYSTNNWGQLADGLSVTVLSQRHNPEGPVVTNVDAAAENGYAGWRPAPGAFGRYNFGSRTRSASEEEKWLDTAIYYGPDHQLVFDEDRYIFVQYSRTDRYGLSNLEDVTGYTILQLTANPEYTGVDRYEFTGWKAYAYAERDIGWKTPEECPELAACFGDATLAETTFEMPFTNVFLTCGYQWKSNYTETVEVSDGRLWRFCPGETYTADNGLALRTAAGARVYGSGARVADNAVSDLEGAVAVICGNVDLANMTFADNSSALGTVILGTPTDRVSGTFRDCTFENNAQPLLPYGGGAVRGDYSGIDGQVTFSGETRFAGNTSGGKGGAIWNNLCSLVFEGHATFESNSAMEGGGAIYNEGGIELRGEITLATPTDTLVNNSYVTWLFANGHRPRLNDYALLSNDADGRLAIALGEDLPEGTYVLAGNASGDLSGKDTFLVGDYVSQSEATVSVNAESPTRFGSRKVRLAVNGNGELVLEVADLSTRFVQTCYEVSGGGAVKVLVRGGSDDASVQATVTYQKNTGAYSAAYVDGRKVSFPLTLSWAKGEIGEKEILFRTTATSRADKDRFFTLQLAGAVGEDVRACRDVCTVTILDAGTGVDADYVRALAWPADGGTVSGYGALANAKSYRTLTAATKGYATFAGWYKAKADDPNQIDLAAPVEPYSARHPRQVRVGYGTDNAAGTYFAYFTNVAAVAAVVEPTPFDAEGKRRPGVAGVTDWYAGGIYRTMVGVKFALPVAFAAAEGTKGGLAVSKLPNGLAYNARKGCIEGVPTKAGRFETKFVASNVAGRHAVTYVFIVDEIPALAVGTFAGTVSDDAAGGPHRTGVGSVSFTAGRTGSLSAKVTRRLSGTRSFAAKGYDYIDGDTLGIALTNAYGEVFAATLSLTDGRYGTALRGTAFGGTKRGTLGYNGEANGVFVAVRNAFLASDGDAEARQVLAAFVGSYAATLHATNAVGEAGEEVGSVRYRVNAQGSVYVAARLAAIYDGEKKVAGRTLSGTVAGAFVYDETTGLGGCGAALRSSTYLWSTEVLLDYATRGVEGAARYIRPNAEDKTEVVDEDEVVGTNEGLSSK